MSCFGVPPSGGDSMPPKDGTPSRSLHQNSQNVSAVVCEITNNDQRTSQNDGRIATHKTDLHIARDCAQAAYQPARAMDQDAVNHANVEYFPESFAGANLNRIDDRRIIDLVHVIFISEQGRHRAQRLALKHYPSDSNAGERDDYRNQCEEAFL